MTYAGELSAEQRLSLLEARVNELERVTGGALFGMDYGFAVGAFHFQRGYTGATMITMYKGATA